MSAGQALGAGERKECCHETVLSRCADCPYQRATTGQAQSTPTPDSERAGGSEWVDQREYLLLASYCGGETPGCTNTHPCANCLAMCNVFDGNGGAFLRQLGEITPERAGGWQQEHAEEEEDLASEWRRLALQFDDHRMRAMAHMRALLADPTGYADKARAFLAEPPVSGEQVLAERLASLVQPNPEAGAVEAMGSVKQALYSIAHHRAVMGDTREGLEAALYDARSLVARFERDLAALAQPTGEQP